LHGQLSEHKYGSGINNTSLRKYAKKIHIVTDQIDNNPQFLQAADSLREANEIYFIGFGYDLNNLKRLPIESKNPPNSPSERQEMSRPSLNVFGTAYDLAPTRRAQVEDYFRNKGFKISLGEGNKGAYQYLRNTRLFGDR
jgi:hypothetical protein